MNAKSEAGRSLVGLLHSAILAPGAFRLVLATVVVASHMSKYDVGRLAVVLFFYLSGYWTIKIWKEKFNSQSIVRFYISRYWRIAPLFIIITILSAWLRNFDLRIENFTLLGIASSNNDPTVVSWSLDIELQFYLLVPIFYLLIVRWPSVTLGASLIAAAIGCWMHAEYNILIVAKFLPAFLLGGASYVYSWRPGRRAAYISLGAFGLATAATAFTPFLLFSEADPFDRDVWAFLWMLPLLPYVAHSLTIRSTKLDRHLGNLSFPLYLVHYPVVAIVATAMGTGLMMKLATLVIIAVLTVLTYIFIDRPIDALRVKVTEG